MKVRPAINPRGWFKPGGSNKLHFDFGTGYSLCGKWVRWVENDILFGAHVLPQSACKKCKTELAKMNKSTEGDGGHAVAANS